MFGIGTIIKNRIRKKRLEDNGVFIEDIRKIGKNFTAEPSVILGDVTIRENVSIGRGTYIRSGVIYQKVKIGRYCSIAFNTTFGATGHPMDWLSTSTFQYDKTSFDRYVTQKPTSVGNDVWVGANAVIMNGITVGDGAVVGAGAIVTKDVPPYAIVVGVPAQIQRYRFDDNTIRELLHLKWWDVDKDIIRTLPFNDIQKCIEILKQTSGM
jgi:acetyltransferase-like isoleucine patch superfamily enzyme